MSHCLKILVNGVWKLKQFSNHLLITERRD